VLHVADGQVISGGPNFEMLVLSAALLVLALVFFVRKAAKPQVILLLLLGAFGFGFGSFAVGVGPRHLANVTVVIESPRDGAVVPAAKRIPLSVDVRGGFITPSTVTTRPNAGHLHVFVDGRIVAMPGATVSSISLKAGKHLVEVEFVAPDHQPFAPPISDSVTVTAR
jgi:hypothetical protein